MIWELTTISNRHVHQPPIHLGSNVAQGHVLGVVVQQENIAVGAYGWRWASVRHDDPAMAPFACTCTARSLIVSDEQRAVSTILRRAPQNTERTMWSGRQLQKQPQP